jgi:hypothetical protein
MKISLIFLLFSVTINAHELCNGIAPKNNWWIGTEKRDANITQDDFNSVLDRIKLLYEPIFEAKGRKLVIKRNWQDGTVNAYASQTGDISYIHMFGGFARHEKTTLDGFALVSCHEIGHHLGGAPKSGKGNWVTNEGQSDYFGTTKCFRLYVEGDDNVGIVSTMDIPEIVTQKCTSVYSSADEVAICQRASMAGLSLGNVLSSLNYGSDVSFDKPSKKKVWWTAHHHPAAQCRLDTYFQGALCDKDYNSDFDDQDANINACTRSEGYLVGMRPRCWYKP